MIDETSERRGSNEDAQVDLISGGSLDLAVDGAIATVTLSRPHKRNALTASMARELLDLVAGTAHQDEVKVIVLRGGGRDFCAGFDVADPRDFEGDADEPRRARLAAINEKAEWMRSLVLCEKPLLAAVHGTCAGIGTYLVLVADMAIATTDASFGLPEERFGSAGATWAYPYLMREIGLKRATEMVMTGRRYPADEMAALGLVNRVVGPDDLEAATAGLARAVCSLPREGIAVNRAVKRLALSTTGHLAAFEIHAPIHAHAERMRREPDELDFMALVAQDGMRRAIAERDRRYGGDWWGW